MAISHAESGQIIDVRPLGTALIENITRALIKIQNLEVIHMIMPAGKEIAEHKMNGNITVQCLEGQITFTAGGKTQELHQGHILYLNGGESHALKSIKNSAVLLTILLK